MALVEVMDLVRKYGSLCMRRESARELGELEAKIREAIIAYKASPDWDRDDWPDEPRA